MALQEAELAIMGLSAADREGGCRDPDVSAVASGVVSDRDQTWWPS